MMKLSLLFLLVSPLAALQLNAPADHKSKKEAALKVNSSAPAQQVDEEDNAERVMRKISKGKGHAWITFVGDSNMRNTYWWWVTSKLNKTGVNFHHTKQFAFKKGDGNIMMRDPKLTDQWSDQEAVLEFPDGFEVRTSFRFLHGSEHEFKFKTSDWKAVSVSGVMENIATADAGFDKIKVKEETFDDPEAIQPSQYAQWAGQNRKLLNLQKESPTVAKSLEKYEDKPDVVVLTEGWGGIPGCNRFDEVLDLFKKNPEVKFVWSPVFMTNRIKSRQQCFHTKLETAPAAATNNFQYLDMWDLASEYPMTKVARGPINTKHMPAGGHYMQEAVDRIEDAIEFLA